MRGQRDGNFQQIKAEAANAVGSNRNVQDNGPKRYRWGASEPQLADYAGWLFRDSRHQFERGTRRAAMRNKKPKPLETAPVLDRTASREAFRADLSAAANKATQMRGLSRVQTISDLLHFADELCADAIAQDDDMSPLAGLLSW
jgi:hypothetical protein